MARFWRFGTIHNQVWAAMKIIAEEERDGWNCADWKEVTGDFFDMLDAALGEFGLQVVIADDEGDTYLWRIEDV